MVDVLKTLIDVQTGELGRDILRQEAGVDFPELPNFFKELEELGDQVKSFVQLLASLLLPQKVSIVTTKERLVKGKLTYGYQLRALTTAEQNELDALILKDRDFMLDFDERARLERLRNGIYEKVVISQEADRIVTDKEEASGRSFLASSYRAFSIWSSIPLLQMIGLTTGTVAGAILLKDSLPVILEKSLPSTEGVIKVATRK